MAGPKAVSQHDAVKAKVDDGMAVKDAISEVAKSLGVTEGTVHTNYYRVRGGRNTPSRPTGEQSSEELLRQAVDALTALAQRANSADKDLERLRRIERALNDN